MVSEGRTRQTSLTYISKFSQCTYDRKGVLSGSGFRLESRVAITPAWSTSPRPPANRSFHAATSADRRQLAVTEALQVAGRLLCGTPTEVRAFRKYIRAVNWPTILSSRW